MSDGKNVLVIPDYHAIPGVDNNRAHALGQYASQPCWDIIVCLGDWWDFPSLCRWSSRSDHEGARVEADYIAGVEAMDIFMTYLKAKKKKRKQLEFFMGNHDIRPEAICKDRPEFKGAFDRLYSPRKYLERLGWSITDFEEGKMIQGFMCSHHFPSGVMGKPIGGENVAKSLCSKLKMSAIVGHSHLKDYKDETRSDGSRIHGINAGCFIHPTHKEGWNKSVRHMYWLGVVELWNAKDGDASVKWTRMEDL